MQTSKTIVRGALVVLFVAGAALSLGCQSEQEENAECEGNAVAQYADDMPDCELQVTECMEDCTDTDIDECLWDCEDAGMNCDMAFSLQLTNCTCTKKSADCLFGCEFDDMQCMMDCSSVYLDCAGSDSPMTCSSMCEVPKMMCLIDCEDEPADIASYVECRAECSSPYLNCLDDCS